MASILQGIITRCRKCFNMDTVRVELFEPLSLDEAQDFVGKNFVKPCKCGQTDFACAGTYSDKKEVTRPVIEERRTSVVP